MRHSATPALTLAIRLPRRRLALIGLTLLAASAALIAGCGGDDPTVPGGATVSAADDSAQVPWNSPTEIDVLANDSASSGALSLDAVGTAAHGSVAIVGGKLVYTPAAGYFGDDSLSYTASTSGGGATAQATVAVSVQARLTLSGMVADAPLAGASVIVDVGAAPFTTTADASGNFSVNVATAQPDDFITVTATGSGAQAQIKLISLAGQAGTLAAAADRAGNVSSADVPTLNATHWSTAQAVLAARANGGAFPATDTALAATRTVVRAAEMLHLAALQRMVADEGVALPAGASDTLALLQDDAQLQAFSRTQTDGNAAAYAAAKAGVLADAPAVAPLALAASGPQTLAYLRGPLVTLRSDGTATVIRGSIFGAAQVAATWTESMGTLTLSYPTPVEYITYSFDVEPVTNIQNQIRVTETGLMLRHITGDRNAGTATVTTLGSAIYLDGNRVGQVPADVDQLMNNDVKLYNVMDTAGRMVIDAADFAAGSRWGGVRGINFGYANNFQDVMRVIDATHAQLENTGVAAQWALADRWLTVSTATMRVRYARLSVDATTGEERWLSVVEGVAGDEDPHTLLMVRVDSGLRFDAAAMARRWRWEDWYAEYGDLVVMNLFGDGSASLDFGNIAPGTGQPPYGWSVDAEGRIVMHTSNRERVVTPLTLRYGQYLVLQTNRGFDANGNVVLSGSTLVHRLADIGAAVKP